MATYNWEDEALPTPEEFNWDFDIAYDPEPTSSNPTSSDITSSDTTSLDTASQAPTDTAPQQDFNWDFDIAYSPSSEPTQQFAPPTSTQDINTDVKLAKNLAARQDNIRSRYADLVAGVFNPESAGQIQDEIDRHIINELRGQGFVVGLQGRDIQIKGEGDQWHTVNDSLLQQILASKAEAASGIVAGLVTGLTVSGKVASAVGRVAPHPIAKVAGTLVGAGATAGAAALGAGIGRLADIEINEGLGDMVRLKERLSRKEKVAAAVDAAIAGAVTEIGFQHLVIPVGKQVLKGTGAVAKGTGRVVSRIPQGVRATVDTTTGVANLAINSVRSLFDSKPMVDYLAKRLDLSPHEAEESLKIAERAGLIGRTGHTEKDQVAALLMNHPGSVEFMKKVMDETPELNLTVRQAIDTRRKFLVETTNSLLPKSVVLDAYGRVSNAATTKLLVDNINTYKQEVKSMFSETLEVGKKLAKRTNANGTIVDATIPIRQKDFTRVKDMFNTLLKYKDKRAQVKLDMLEKSNYKATKMLLDSPKAMAQEATMEDLYTMRQLLNQIDVDILGSNHTAETAKIIKEGKNTIDKYIKELAYNSGEIVNVDGKIVNTADDFVRLFDQANAEYASMKDFDKNVLTKFIGSGGAADHNIADRLVKYMNATDSVDGVHIYTQFMSKLPPQSRDAVEGLIANKLISDASIFSNSGFVGGATDLLKLDTMFKNAKFTSPQLRKLGAVIEEYKNIYRNDTDLFRVGATVNELANKNYLAVNPETRLKMWTMNMFFTWFRSYLATDEGFSSAIIRTAAKVISNPLSIKATEAMEQSLKNATEHGIFNNETYKSFQEALQSLNTLKQITAEAKHAGISVADTTQGKEILTKVATNASENKAKAAVLSFTKGNESMYTEAVDSAMSLVGTAQEQFIQTKSKELAEHIATQVGQPIDPKIVEDTIRASIGRQSNKQVSSQVYDGLSAKLSDQDVVKDYTKRILKVEK